MTIIVLSNQSFMDISIQHTGSVYNAFIIAAANGMSVSESPVSGSSLIVPEEAVKDEDILSYFRSNGIRPATGLTDQEMVEETNGIGWMKITKNFKVR